MKAGWSWGVYLKGGRPAGGGSGRRTGVKRSERVNTIDAAAYK